MTAWNYHPHGSCFLASGPVSEHWCPWGAKRSAQGWWQDQVWGLTFRGHKSHSRWRGRQNGVLRTHPSEPDLWELKRTAGAALPSLASAGVCTGAAHGSPFIPFTRLPLSVPGERGCAADAVLVREPFSATPVCMFAWVCQPLPIPVLIPFLARSLYCYLAQLLCISPCDWYSNILTSCFLHRNISSTEFSLCPGDL